MRYILNDSGYIQAVSFNNLLECQNKSCTEYTGEIPTGYESLAIWSENANINAYKIVNGNLTYDSEEDARLQSLWASQEVSSGASLNEVINLLFPVGKVEIFFDNDDHSNHLGFKWERTSVGRVPVGIDSNDSVFNTIGKTGGEKTHTLTIDEMPSHKHSVYVDKNTGVTGSASMYPVSYIQSASNYIDLNVVIPSGNNQPHNNLQPYEVMAFWKRIS